MANLTGIWYNELGSAIKIEADGLTITGYYYTAVGDADPSGYYLVGRTDSDNDSSQAVGWVVAWQNANYSSDSVTSWSGQYQLVNGVPTIVTTWLLTQETDVKDDWKSTLIGKDVFTQNRPSEKQIEESRNKGIVASSPVA